MQTRKFQQNKLWRDKAVDRCEQLGSKLHWQQLENEAFEQQLKLKLVEEAEEVGKAPHKAALIEELADVLEVITSLSELYQVSLQEVLAVQHKKREERGGFAGRKFVTLAEHPVGSFGESYCLKDPQKYPEVSE